MGSNQSLEHVKGFEYLTLGEIKKLSAAHKRISAGSFTRNIVEEFNVPRLHSLTSSTDVGALVVKGLCDPDGGGNGGQLTLQAYVRCYILAAKSVTQEKLKFILRLFGSNLGTLIECAVSLAIHICGMKDERVARHVCDSLKDWATHGKGHSSGRDLSLLTETDYAIEFLMIRAKRLTQHLETWICGALLGDASCVSQAQCGLSCPTGQGASIVPRLHALEMWILSVPLSIRRTNPCKADCSLDADLALNRIPDMTLLFSSKRDGRSCTTLAEMVGGYKGSTYLFIQTRDSSGIFGAYIATPWEEGNPASAYFGNAEFFLFSTDSSNPRIYSSMGIDQNYMIFACNDDTTSGISSTSNELWKGVGFGGQKEHFRVFLGENLISGTTKSFCSTFQRGSILRDDGSFQVENVEVYGIGGKTATEAQRRRQATKRAVAERSKKVNRAKFFGQGESTLDNTDKAILDLVGLTGFSDSVRHEDEDMERQRKLEEQHAEFQKQQSSQ